MLVGQLHSCVCMGLQAYSYDLCLAGKPSRTAIAGMASWVWGLLLTHSTPGRIPRFGCLPQQASTSTHANQPAYPFAGYLSVSLTTL